MITQTKASIDSMHSDDNFDMYFVWNKHPSNQDIEDTNEAYSGVIDKIIHCYRDKDIIIKITDTDNKISYEDYLKAKKTIIAFRKNFIKEIDMVSSIGKEKMKDSAFRLLEKIPNIRTVDLAEDLKISRQLAHKYKQDFIKKNPCKQ